MSTTADFLSALADARDALSDNITANGGTVTGQKFDVLAEDVKSIVWGNTHFLTGSGTVNRDGTYYPSAFTVTVEFLPSRLVINFPTVLSGAFSDNVAYTMIGRLTLPEISANGGAPQTHTVTLTTGTGTEREISLTTTVAQLANGRYTLTVTLPTSPERYVFRGSFDWLCVDAAWEGDEE